MKQQSLTPFKMKGKNGLTKKRILSHLIYNGPDSLASLSREMALSVPTVTKLVGELLTDGYLIDCGKQETNGGRRPNIYGIRPDSGYFVGVDIKRDGVHIAMLDFTGEMVMDMKQPSLVDHGSDAGIDALCQQIDSFIEMASVERSKVLSIGICVGSRVRANTGEAFSVFTSIDGSLRDILHEKLGIPVLIDNDSRSMAFGEYMSGVVEKQRHVLFVNINWGLGLGVIIDGQLYYGRSGFAGEFGHMSMFDNEVICRCGKKGCLETEVSGSALYRRFMEQLQNGSSSILAAEIQKGTKIGLQDIVDAAKNGDILSIELIESIGAQLGKHLSGMINLFNPELVILGGALADAGDYLLLPVQSSVKKFALNIASADTQIAMSTLGDQAGVLGICLLARQKLFGIA